jgi:hypothetical protein
LDESLSLILVLIRLAIAVEPLPVTAGATLDVASLNMELTFDDAAIVARVPVCAPVV